MTATARHIASEILAALQSLSPVIPLQTGAITMKGLVRHGNKWRIDTRTGGGQRLRSPSFSDRAEAVRWGEPYR